MKKRVVWLYDLFLFLKLDFKTFFLIIEKKYIYKFSGKSFSSCEKVSGDFFFTSGTGHYKKSFFQCFFYFSIYETEWQKVFRIFFLSCMKADFSFFLCVKPGEKQALVFTALSERLLYYCLCSVMMSCNIWDHRESGKQDSRRTALPNCEDIFSMIAFL